MREKIQLLYASILISEGNALSSNTTKQNKINTLSKLTTVQSVKIAGF